MRKGPADDRTKGAVLASVTAGVVRARRAGPGRTRVAAAAGRMRGRAGMPGAAGCAGSVFAAMGQG